MQLPLALGAAALLASASALFAANRTTADPVPKTPRGFPVHTVESAPEGSRAILEGYREGFGLVPNVAAIMAEAPALLSGYAQLQNQLRTAGTLTPEETNLVQLAISVENKCQYCTAAHTMMGKSSYGTEDAVLAALRTGEPLPDAKLEALRSFASSVYAGQGRISDEAWKAFTDAGYTHAQALEVVASISAKVITNFTNQLTGTPVDAPFRGETEGLSFREDRPFAGQ